MQQEIEQEQPIFDYNIASIKTFIHSQQQDILEEYVKKQKKKKATNSNPYKDLRDRNGLLTVYRSVQQESSENKQDYINIMISWLQNHQKPIIEKSESERLVEKSFIKHILTQKITKPLDSNAQDYLKNNQTLVHYLVEAAEKQSEGFVNNVLTMIQPLKNPTNLEYINYFAQSVSYQMKQSRKTLNSTEQSLRCNKVTFINLTGKESIKNLDDWYKGLEKQEEFIYISLIKILKDNDINSQFSAYKDYFTNMKQSTCNYILLPYVNYEKKSQKNLLNGQLLKILFKNFIHNRIEKFAHNTYIALSLSLSDDIDYDIVGLQFLIQNLIKLSHNRLIIHIDVEIDEKRIDFETRLKQLMNICYISFQEQNIQIDKLLPKKNMKLLEILTESIQHYKTLDLSHLITPILYSKIALQNQNQQFLQIYKGPQVNMFRTFQRILYKQNSNKFLIIIPILQNNDVLSPNTQIFINYKEEVIVLYQDGKRKYLYFVQLDTNHFQQSPSTLEIEFQNLSSILESDSIQNQIVFYHNYNIYVLYGLVDDQIKMDCTRYNTQQNKLDRLLYKETENFNQGTFHSRIAFSKLNKQQLEEKLKFRVSPNVCVEKSTEQGFVVILFGGENVNSPQVMSLVEYIEIRDTYFFSGILEKQNLYKELSLKPYSNQTILCYKYNNETYFLFLPGNDQLRKKKQNHPVNIKFSQNAQLMKKAGLEFSFQNVPINYYGTISYGLNNVATGEKNIQLIYQNQNLFLVWRVIYTQSLKIESLQKLKLAHCLSGNKYQLQTEIQPIEQQFVSPLQEAKVVLSYLIQNDYKKEEIKEFLDKQTNLDLQEPYLQNYYQMIQEQNYDLNPKSQQNSNIMQIEELNQSDELKNLKDKETKLNFQVKAEFLIEQKPENNPSDLFNTEVVTNYEADNFQFYQVAFENYIFLDLNRKHIGINQFTYLLEKPIPLPRIDLLDQVQSQVSDDVQQDTTNQGKSEIQNSKPKDAIQNFKN